MKIITTAFLLILVVNVYSQSDSLKMNHKKKFVSIATIEASNMESNSEKIIIDNDTLIDISSKSNLSSLLDRTIINDTKFLRQYRYIVFRSFNTSKNSTVRLVQWNAPVVIYLDKAIPKIIKEEFKAFISQFKGINNLSITISSEIDDANYLVTLVNEKIQVYTEDQLKNYDEDQKKELTFLNMTYNLINDNNDKYYCATLKINKASVLEDPNTITKLKKAFFMSLGSFTEVLISNKESFLNSSYINNKEISEFDKNILKVHYNTIYDFKVDLKTFIEIEKSLKNSNEN